MFLCPIILALTLANGVAPVASQPVVGLCQPSGGNPVLAGGIAGSWDGGQAIGRQSVMLDGSAFKMWYSSIASDSSPYQIGDPPSIDGIYWTKYPPPVLLPGPP